MDSGGFDNVASCLDPTDIRVCISKAVAEKDVGALQRACNSVIQSGNSPDREDLDLYVLCAEAALQLGRAEISKPCLKIYFEGNPPANQFLCRAYLCQGQLECPPATGSAEDFEKAADCFLKAIEVAKTEPRHDSVKLIKFADDTTLIGLISNNDESAYRREVDRLVSWCSGNNLELNAQKTVEMIVDFRKSTVPPPPPSVMDSPITSVESFRFLGTTITQDLKWEPTISSLIKKAQQRMYFLRQLRKAKLPAQMLVQFYTAIIESILTSSITVWFAGATVRDKQRLQRIVRSAEEVIGRSLPSLQDLFHGLVFNASVLYIHTLRPLLQSGRSFHLLPSLRQVLRSLEEVNDPDHDWRAKLMMQLIKCCVDGGKTEEARSLAKVTEEFVKCHTSHLFPELFSLLMQHKLSDRDVLFETSQQTPTLTAIYKLDEFKTLSSVNGDELREEDAGKLQDIFDWLVSAKKPSFPTESDQQPLPPAARVAFLLELAMLALQTKHQKVAADCLKELKTAKEAQSASQRIIMECISVEIRLLKKEAKMNEYSKGSVEARLREIGWLDQWLLNAERAGDPQAVQAVCASVWRLCLPLLQHNLRRSIRGALLRLAQALEDIQRSVAYICGHEEQDPGLML
uniref:Alkylated DNA repair protein AlkB homologue 8 N-terminal domain-containing protein n=1 Tax=Knipowitschia caucasica TaxID=637954 RepID=A0AAV2JLJ3_KNICA